MRDAVYGEGIGKRVVRAAVDRDEIGILHGLLRLGALLRKHDGCVGEPFLSRDVQIQRRSQIVDRQIIARGFGVDEEVDVYGAVAAVGHVVEVGASDGLADEIGVAALHAGAVQNGGLGNGVACQTVSCGDAVTEDGVGVVVLHARSGGTADGEQADCHHRGNQQREQAGCVFVHISILLVICFRD